MRQTDTLRQQIIVAVGAGLVAVIFLAAWVLSLPAPPAALLTAAPTATPPVIATPIAVAAQPTAAPTLQPTAMPTPLPNQAATALPTLPPASPPAPTLTPPPAGPTPPATPTLMPNPTVPAPTATPLPPLFIDVESPGYETIVRRPGAVTVRGQTLPGSLVQIFNTIRGIGQVAYSELSDADGRFAITVSLDQGLNSLEIRATHAATGAAMREFWQIRYAPVSVELTVRINEPAGLALFVRESPLRIVGKTTPGATVVVNDLLYPDVSANGDWSITIGLREQGEHTITAAASLDGKTVTDEITVTYTPQ